MTKSKQILPQQLFDRIDFLRRTIKELTEVDPLKRDRHRIYVTARIMLCYALKLDGWTPMQIGGALNYEHSTIIWYYEKMDSILTIPGYDAERQLWNRYKKRIDNELLAEKEAELEKIP